MLVLMASFRCNLPCEVDNTKPAIYARSQEMTGRFPEGTKSNSSQHISVANQLRTCTVNSQALVPDPDSADLKIKKSTDC